MADSCEYNNESTGTIKCGEVSDELSDYHFMKKEPCSMSLVPGTVRWEGGLVVQIGALQMHIKSLSKSLKGKDHLGDMDRDRTVLLKWIFKKLGCKHVNWIQIPQCRSQRNESAS